MGSLMKIKLKVITTVMGSVVAVSSFAVPAEAAISTHDDVSSISVANGQVLTEEYQGDSAPLNLKMSNKTTIVSDLGLHPANRKVIHTGTQCIDENHSPSWYGMTVRKCKDASGSKFTVYNADSQAMISVIQLHRIMNPRVLASKELTLGCMVAAVSLILSTPVSPTNIVGWAIKGSTILLSTWGLGLSC